MVLLWPPRCILSPLPDPVVKDVSSKEHPKQVIWVKLLLVELLLVPLAEILLRPVLVVHPPLGRVAQTGKRLTHLLEGVRRLRSLVLVRMKL